MLQCQVDVIQVVEYVVVVEIVDFKVVGFIFGFNYLCFQIYFKCNVWVGLYQFEQFIDLFVVQGYWQQLVIEVVVVKDIGKVWGDNDFKVVIGQCLWCVFV